MTTEQLRSQLFSLAEPAYQAFSSSLLPGVSGVLGVRLPVCRKIARQLGKDGWQDWLEEFFALPDPFFEEAMIAGMTIALTPMDPEERIRLIRRFLPRIFEGRPALSRAVLDVSFRIFHRLGALLPAFCSGHGAFSFRHPRLSGAFSRPHRLLFSSGLLCPNGCSMGAFHLLHSVSGRNPPPSSE